MRAVVITRPGGPEVLALRDVPAPRPAPGELLVRVHATALNRADLLQRRGAYAAPEGAPPDIPGLEFAGTVEALGDGVEGWSIGDRVMGLVGGGGYAEYVTVPASHALHVPESLTLEQAAAVPEAYLTAHDALFTQGSAQAPEWVLVHAIASGVGVAALQLGNAFGLRIVGTAMRSRSVEEKAEVTRRFASQALELFDRGLLQPVVDRVFPMEDVRHAHERMEKNENVGKILLAW